MLINEQRALAYNTKISWVRPIDGADRIELVGILGWTCVAKKGEFRTGDDAIYFEIDSKLPETEWSAFMEAKHYKVKTMKLGKFNVISQGLALPIDGFDCATAFKIRDAIGDGAESVDLTQLLGVTYSVEEDNQRKSSPNPKAKYSSMKARHPKFFANPTIKQLMKHEWFRKTMFLFLGKKRDKPNEWPAHIAAKTDVERVQNMPWVFDNKNPYIATEKVDGSSCSIMAERKAFGRIKYYICSRNVVFKDENQKCYYDDNIYFEMYHKYNLKEIITNILDEWDLDNVAIQMEVYGANVQKRNYSTNEHQIAVFHIVSNRVKFPMDKTIEICEKYGLPHVPVIDYDYILPDTIEELQEYVEGAPSAIDGLPKEGIVFYDKATGQQYFKFVSPNYLLKYHQ